MKPVATRFSAAATTYNQAAKVQLNTANRLIHSLPADLQPQSILEIGCGTGYLTALLRQKFPGSSIDALDISPGMIAEARQNLPGASINWFTGSVHDLSLSQPYQLVTSSSALHWLYPLPCHLEVIVQKMDRKACLACAFMLSGTLGELKQLHQELFPHKSPEARLPTLTETRQALAANSLQIKKIEVETVKLPYRSAEHFLRSLNRQGVTSGHFSRKKIPLTRNELQLLIESYDNMFAGQNYVTATYEIVYVVADKQ